MRQAIIWTNDGYITDAFMLHSTSMRNIIHQMMKNMHWKGPQMKFPDHTMSLYFKFLAFKWTRQNLRQSVGNMPPLPPPHLLPHVLQIMPRNHKYDQFESKGHHNEENPHSMTKIPKFDPFQEVKIVPKLRKSTNCNHNLLSSEDAHDTSACKMPGHFLNGFSRKCLETPNLTHFTKSK